MPSIDSKSIAEFAVSNGVTSDVARQILEELHEEEESVRALALFNKIQQHKNARESDESAAENDHTERGAGDTAGASTHGERERGSSSQAPEPLPRDEDVINFIIRIPSGQCLNKVFPKDGNFRVVFDFIRIATNIKTDTYSLVREYPMREFWFHLDKDSTFEELGFNNQREVLSIEMMET